MLSSFEEQSDDARTLVFDEDEATESKVVAALAFNHKEAKMTLVSAANRPGIAATIFIGKSEAGVNVDMIAQI